MDNPFSNFELQEIFEKQRDKVPFEIEKTASDENGVKWTLNIRGDSISDKYFDIWKDDYIIYFNRNSNNRGGGYARSRFPNVDELKAEILNAFHLSEEEQLSLFGFF